MLREQDKKFLIEKSSNLNKRKKSHKRQKDIQKETAKSNTKENKYIFFKKKREFTTRKTKKATKTQQIKSVFISLRKVNSTFYTYF